jgi:hypothetical protein
VSDNPCGIILFSGIVPATTGFSGGLLPALLVRMPAEGSGRIHKYMPESVYRNFLTKPPQEKRKNVPDAAAPRFLLSVFIVKKTKDILRVSCQFTCRAGISNQSGWRNSTIVLQRNFQDFYVFCSVR